jgi:hypothetical protein
MDECKPLPRTVDSEAPRVEHSARESARAAVALRLTAAAAVARPSARGLHSSTFRLNVSTFCWIRYMHDFPPVYYTGGQGEV